MEDVATYLLTQGVLGIAVLVMGVVVRALYKDVKRLEAEKIQFLQDSKDEAVETAKEVLTVLRDNSQNIAVLSEKIEVVKYSPREKQ